MNRFHATPRLARGVLVIGASMLVPAFAGCGSSGPEKASVYGTVSYNGKPVPKGTISFQASGPEGRNATGAIQPDGTYNLQTETLGDGAQLGNYRVAIYAREDAPLDYIPKKAAAPKRLVPEKFENPETSELTATVKSGSNPINFPLAD